MLKIKWINKSEAREESGLEIDDLTQVGYIEFQFESKMDEMLECHVFQVEQFRGTIRECEGKIEQPLYAFWKKIQLMVFIFVRNYAQMV